IRLFSKHSFDSRPSFETPEIARADLSQPVLELKALGVDDVAGFPWFESPQPAALESAVRLLQRLGALDERGLLTPTGKRMAQMPVHPRLARLVIEGERLQVGLESCRLAALLSE